MLGASLALHALVLAALLWAAPGAAPGTPETPTYDLVFEGGGEAAAPAEQASRPSTPDATPQPGTSPDALPPDPEPALPDTLAGPPSPTPLSPPDPDATPALPEQPGLNTAEAARPSERLAGSPAPPSPPEAPETPQPPTPADAETAPTAPEPLPPGPMQLAAPAEAERTELPPATPAAPPQVRLEAPPSPAPAPPPPFVLPTPPEPLPEPPRPRPAPQSRTAGTLANPLDLDFGPSASRAPAPRTTARRGTVASRSIDLSPGAPKGLNRQQAFFAARAANATAEWVRDTNAYLARHGYYPRQAAENGEDGTVELEITVKRSGQVTDVSVRSRSGSSWLDLGALSILRNAKLTPLPDELEGDTVTIPVRLSYLLRR